MASVGHSERWEAAGHKRVACITVQLPPSSPPLPPATAALSTKSFYVQVPAVLHCEPDSQKALTAPGLWRGDTINSLSEQRFVMLVLSMWMALFPHLFFYSAARCNFAHVISKEAVPKIEDKRTTIKMDSKRLFCLSAGKSISESSHPRHINQIRKYGIVLFLLYEVSDNLFMPQ